jgi:hypothetical protein
MSQGRSVFDWPENGPFGPVSPYAPHFLGC